MSAVEFVPAGNINGKNIYGIYNFTTINATRFFGNGSGLTGITAAVGNETDPVFVANRTSIWDAINAGSLPDIYFVSQGNATDIQTKINSCSGTRGCIVYVPGGYYNLSSSKFYFLSVKNKGNWKLIGLGNVTFDISSQGSDRAIYFEGSRMEQQTITAYVPEGSRVISVNDSSVFKAGDYVSINDNQTGPVHTILNATKAEIGRIDYISGNDVYLLDNTTYNYSTSNNPKLIRIVMLENIELNNIEIKSNDSYNTKTGLLLNFTSNVVLRDLRIHDVGDSGALIKNSYNIKIFNNEVYNINTRSTGYGFSSEGASKFIYIYNNLIHDVDEGLDCGSSEGFPSYLYWHDNTIHGTNQSGIDQHPNCHYVFIYNNELSNINEDGITADATHVYVKNNRIYDVGDNGINCGTEWTGYYKPFGYDCHIEYNTIYRTGTSTTSYAITLLNPNNQNQSYVIGNIIETDSSNNSTGVYHTTHTARAIKDNLVIGYAYGYNKGYTTFWGNNRAFNVTLFFRPASSIPTENIEYNFNTTENISATKYYEGGTMLQDKYVQKNHSIISTGPLSVNAGTSTTFATSPLNISMNQSNGVVGGWLSAVDYLYFSGKLNATDQRYNETTFITSNYYNTTVSDARYPKLADNNVFTGMNNFTGILWINNINSTNTTGYSAAREFIENGINLSNKYVSRNDWTTHDSYPAACAGGGYVEAIGDTLTCSSPSGTVYFAGAGIIKTVTTFSLNTTIDTNMTFNNNLTVGGTIGQLLLGNGGGLSWNSTDVCIVSPANTTNSRNINCVTKPTG